MDARRLSTLNNNSLKTTTLLIVVGSLVILSACKEKQEPTDIIVPKQTQQAPAEPVAMQDNDYVDEIDWTGKRYLIEINRRSDKELPMVSNAQGAKYYDNRFTVTVRRSDGTTFFSREFTKNDFADNVDAQFLHNNALLGIVFEEAQDTGLLFAASIGDPDPLSDEYVPLIISLSRTGNLSIRRDTRPEN